MAKEGECEHRSENNDKKKEREKSLLHNTETLLLQRSQFKLFCKCHTFLTI